MGEPMSRLGPVTGVAPEGDTGLTGLGGRQTKDEYPPVGPDLSQIVKIAPESESRAHIRTPFP